MSETAGQPERSPADVGEGARIEYELHDWPIESRQMIRQLLLGAEVPHVWQGGRLVVPESAEETVDDLVDQVEESTTGTLLDPDAEHVAFDVDDWDDELVGQLTSRLDERNIPWVFTAQGELVVMADHSDQVESVVDAIEFPDALEIQEESPETADEAEEGGVEIDPDAVLGGLFVACDRLARNAADSNGARDLVGLHQTLSQARMPFGYDPKVWDDIRSSTADLVAKLEADDPAEVVEERIEQEAAQLREVLRSWV